MTGEGTVIRVGPAPEPFTAEAGFADGASGQPERARLSIDEPSEVLLIDLPGRVLRWPLAEVRQVPDQAGGDRLVLRRAGDPVARVMTEATGLAARCPHLQRREPVVRRGRLIAWAGAALASVAVIVFVLVPLMADQLARYIPPEGERALGEATLGQIRRALDESGMRPVPVCAAPDGEAALDRIEARLQDALGAQATLSVHVLDHEMVNAFALPGGFVVFFRGLIEAAETPEEVAAVMAHEIGHVVSRDPTRHALRSAGSMGVLGLVLGDFAGGAAVLMLAERLIQASYSREAEAAADAFATDLLREAELPPGALGRFFARLAEESDEPPRMLRHFLSHPEIAERIAAAERAARPEETRELLTPRAWEALKAICDETTAQNS